MQHFNESKLFLQDKWANVCLYCYIKGNCLMPQLPCYANRPTITEANFENLLQVNHQQDQHKKRRERPHSKQREQNTQTTRTMKSL